MRMVRNKVTQLSERLTRSAENIREKPDVESGEMTSVEYIIVPTQADDGAA